MVTRSLFLPVCLLLIAAGLTGCINHEDDFISKYCPGSCTVVKGRITTADGTKPIRDVTLTANWDNSYHWGGGTIRKKAVARTDENGYYTLSFLLRDEELEQGYIVIESSLDKQKYFICQSDDILQSETIGRDTTILRDYYFPERAHLLLELTNRQALGPDDNLATKVSSLAGMEAGQECSQLVSWRLMDGVTHTVSVAAESPVLLTNTRTKANLITTQTDTLYLSPGERRTYRVAF
ncbi:hypothetical protein [Pontibacter sp. HJ8]